MKKQELLQFTSDIGLLYCGISSAEILTEFSSVLKKRNAHFLPCSFEEPEIEKRCNPFLILPGAKSIITCLFPYYSKELHPKNLSRFSAVRDYHKVAMKKLTEIAEMIETKTGEKCKTFTDNSPLPDRLLAYRAGLGFFGKNHMLIHPKLGSYFFIGSIITTLYLEADSPMETQCIGCEKCIEACPGGALTQNGLDPFCCVSYISQAKEWTNEQRALFSSQSTIYGCDVCQEVCPYNQGLCDTILPEFLEEKLDSLLTEDVFSLSNRAFREKYGSFPFAWRGKKLIERNLREKELDKICD